MMRITHILPALALLTALLACTKTTVYPEPQEPGTIFLSATESGTTKAMFTGQTFGAAGNTLQIYDYVTDCDEVVSEPYINSLALSDGNGGWPFVKLESGEFTQQSYNWTSTGVHKFFGWLVRDYNTFGEEVEKTSGEFFGGLNYDSSTKILTIPSKAMTQSTEQFDFMYSDIVTCDVEDDDFDSATAVNLNFNHLFTAFGIEVKNASNQPVTIHEFRIEGLPNRKSAEINFAGSAPTMTPTTLDPEVEGEGDFIAVLDEGLTIPAGQMGSPTIIKDIFNPTAAESSLFLMWPMSSEEIHSVNEATEEGDKIIFPDDWKMYIKYSTGEVANVVSRLNFPEGDWKAGKKNIFTITFADKIVSINSAVAPWDYQSQEVSLTDEVRVTEALEWSDCILIGETMSAMIANGKPAVGTFTIESPVGATWLASITGDLSAFEISPKSGVIDGTPATITVTPKIDSPARDYKVKVRFAIRLADGTIVPAQAVNPVETQYTVVLGKM